MCTSAQNRLVLVRGSEYSAYSNKDDFCKDINISIYLPAIGSLRNKSILIDCDMFVFLHPVTTIKVEHGRL